MLTVNMKQMDKWVVTEDNVRCYDYIIRTSGRVLSLDYKPYIEYLNEFNIFFTLKGASWELAA